MLIKHWFKILVAVYMMATLFCVFFKQDTDAWGVYREGVVCYSFIVLFLGCINKNKTEKDKSILVALVLLKIFNWITYLIWFITGSNWQSTPLVFCVLVVVSLLLGLLLNKKILWK